MHRPAVMFLGVYRGGGGGESGNLFFSFQRLESQVYQAPRVNSVKVCPLVDSRYFKQAYLLFSLFDRY